VSVCASDVHFDGHLWLDGWMTLLCSKLYCFTHSKMIASVVVVIVVVVGNNAVDLDRTASSSAHRPTVAAVRQPTPEPSANNPMFGYRGRDISVAQIAAQWRVSREMKQRKLFWNPQIVD
jgi:hypothetical protein